MYIYVYIMYIYIHNMYILYGSLNTPRHKKLTLSSGRCESQKSPSGLENLMRRCRRWVFLCNMVHEKHSYNFIYICQDI